MRRSGSLRDRTAALLYASSGTALVFVPRAFSNSIAALLLGIVLSRASASPSALAACAAAAVTALGIWTRPDFALFAAPSGVAMLGRLRRRPAALVVAGGVFAATCVALALVDSLYFGHGLSLRTITPLNSIRYNLDPGNLAEHGVHPRWLHAIVNLPIMFGVGAYVALWATVRMRDGSARCTSSTGG